MAGQSATGWQRKAGIGAAVALLLLALVYRFLPSWLMLPPTVPATSTSVSSSSASLGNAAMSLNSAPASAGTSIYSAGPPLALAPLAARVASAPQYVGAPAVVDLLKQAHAAELAERWAGTPDSAAALYQRALALAPGNADARAGLSALSQRLASNAGQAIDDGDAKAAQALLNLLRKLPGGLTATTPLQARLFVLEHVRPLLREAAEQERAGHALSPAGFSALDLYRRVLMLDPGNVVATRGVRHLQHGVLLQARAALAGEDYPRVSRLLARAASVAPDSPELIAMRAQFEQARREHARALVARADAALQAHAPQLAQQLAAQARLMDSTLPELANYAVHLRDTRLYDGYRPGQVFADNFIDRAGSAPTMVVIPAGTFMMGSRPGRPGFRSDQAPAHTVTFSKGFALARSEISVAQFRAFVRATGYVTDAERDGGAMVYDELSGRMRMDPSANWRDGYNGQPAAGDLPVINISWSDAEAYCDWLSKATDKDYRLPSEAEYEYAERGGTTTPYWWGYGSPKQRVENLAGSLDRSPKGRHWDNSFRDYGDGYWGPAPVRSFLPNPYGLFDIDGNVSEWTEDCWHDNYVRAPDNGSTWVNPGCQNRVVRGGSWASTPDQALSAWRMDVPADLRSARIGFRVMRSL
ncbi:SUMF1/EgtB/PvdO family nonheme iron enzyme [Metallibacterium sp.]|uniref:SUMF1/EgtB/PvdO family nonheme iron enzyme n=1 Tax=Metallibacterium sp. TaxID=2940281 RepID=UPI00262BE387|nr:SUMF1/EgtB/PvdO family nonheme iron enzyme [Metallibacterium sp.]